MFEVPSQQLWGTFATAFWRTTHNWRFYGHGSTYVLILSSRLEKKSWNKNRRSSLESCKLHKNPSLHFEQHCTKIDHTSLILISFFFSQASLIFKFNLVLIGVLDSFRTIYIPVCLLIIICYFTDLEVHPVHLYIS